MTANGSGKRRLLKILHVDPERNWGGGEAQVYRLLSYLAAQGHRNQILTHPEGRLFDACQKITVERVPFIVRNDLDVRAALSLRSRIAKEPFDIVHFHTKRAHAMSFWLGGHGNGPKYVVTRRMDYPEKAGWYTNCLYNRRVDGVVAISQTIADLLVDAGVRKTVIRLIHSGIDVAEFAHLSGAAGISSRVPTVGSLAALEERKGLAYLFDALAILAKAGMKFHCRIAGSGSQRGELERKVHSLGLAPCVTFLDFTSDRAGFLQGIDLFVMPSLFEGLGVAALEAMAAGKAVVASCVGGLRESIVDGVTGLLVPPRDGEALAAAMQRCLKDPAMTSEMGRKGRERVLEHFTMERMAAKNEAFYYELLGVD